MLNSPKFSIIIPCYNYGKYLPLSIGSVLAQSNNNYEIIIVNDGSTDNTKEIVKDIIKKNSSKKITLMNQENAGQPAISRNNGIKQASGEFILCLDADDMIDSTMLEKFSKVLDLNPNVSVVYTDAIFFNEEGTEIKYSGKFDLNLLVITNQLFCCSLFSKEAWQVVGGFNTNVRGYEDWDFWISLAEHNFNGYKIDEALFHYRTGKEGLYSAALNNDSLLKANIILNHPKIFDESTKLSAKNYIEANS
jgi:glycosyltransferase involved in cell wall biosynthesis